MAYTIDPAVHARLYEMLAAVDGICEKLGLPGTVKKTFGGSDQANLALHGVQGLVLSSGMMQVHTCQEYVLISELEKLTALVKLLMQEEE